MNFVNEKSGILFWSLSSCSPKLKLKIENDKFCGLYSSFFFFFFVFSRVCFYRNNAVCESLTQFTEETSMSFDELEVQISPF